MRKIKYLFSVPAGEKVTEKHFYRVLISSICSIVLCMTCLVSTTWAWFTVSVSNDNNVIQVGNFEVTWKINKVDTTALAEDQNPEFFGTGAYQISITNLGNVDGYCQVVITPYNVTPTANALSEATEAAGASGAYATSDAAEATELSTLSTDTGKTFYTEMIAAGQSINFSVTLDKPSTIEITPIWGSINNVSTMGLLGSINSVSGGDVVPTEESTANIKNLLEGMKELLNNNEGGNVATDGSAEAATDGSAEAATDESAGAATDESAGAATDESAEAATDESAGAATDESAEAATDETAGATTDGSAGAATDETTEVAQDASAESQESSSVAESGI